MNISEEAERICTNLISGVRFAQSLAVFSLRGLEALGDLESRSDSRTVIDLMI